MSRPFQLLIKPVGADCNMRCDYCFYLRAAETYEAPGRHIMSDAIAEKLIAGLLQLRFPQSVFAWQGGEPTLAGLDFFRNVVRLQMQYGTGGQAVGNSIQTNGTLLDADWCHFFRQYSFLIGLSLDGPAEVHDAVRKNALGAGSWRQVVDAARLMERHEVEFNILCVLNRHNIAMGADLLRWYVAQGWRFLQFIPCMEKDSPHNVTPEQYAQFLCRAFDYWSEEALGQVYVRDFDVLLAQFSGVQDRLCIYGRRCNDYILIEHTGDVYPCDFFMYPEWKLGNVMDGPLESFVETDLYKRFANQKDKVASCRGCPWRQMCHGGCQKDRIAVSTIANPTPFCQAYKEFFSYAVPRLQSLAKRLRRRQTNA